MKLQPSPSQKRKTVVGIARLDGVTLEDGSTISFAEAYEKKGLTVFVRDDDLALQIVKHFGGRAHWRKQRFTQFIVEGVRLRSLRHDFTMDELLAVRDWLYDRSTKIGSYPTVALDFLRAGLRRPLLFGYAPSLPDSEISIGGRSEYSRGVYHECSFWDITGAYHAICSTVFVGKTYKHFDNVSLKDLRSPGFTRAVVAFPEGLELGPLPVLGQNRAFYPHKGAKGVWDNSELALALALGATIVPLEGWQANGITMPFASWGEELEKGRRELSGGSAEFLKLVANSLWGIFVSRGKGVWIWYKKGGKEYTRTASANRNPTCYVVGAHIVASQRKRLYEEALNRRVVMANTDGAAFIGLQSKPGGMIGEYLGQWRHKKDGYSVVILDRQAHSYIDANGERHYVLSGVPKEHSRKAFLSVLEGSVKRSEMDEGKLPGDLRRNIFA